jgi:hypothetical protein
MIKIFTVVVMSCLLSSAIAQKDMIDRIEKQAVVIDSLKTIVKTEISYKEFFQNENNRLKDTLKRLRYDLENLQQSINGKKNFDSILKQKIDSILLLRVVISERDKQIILEKQNVEQKAVEENEKGKNEILTVIINKYKTQSFDFLLKSSTKQSVEHDLFLFQGIPELRLLLIDMVKVFNAKELLDNQLDASLIKNIQIEVGQIKRESLTLGKIKDIIGNYQTLNEGLKETLERIIALDKREMVSGMSNEIRKKKLDKILAEFSSYIFNYEYNFSDYPYLSGIILEIIKRKQPNADADISDLLKKL